MAEHVCARCGNDGSKGGLYVAVDAYAMWDQHNQRWVLEYRENDPESYLDCLACGHQTPLWETSTLGVTKE